MINFPPHLLLLGVDLDPTKKVQKAKTVSGFQTLETEKNTIRDGGSTAIDRFVF